MNILKDEPRVDTSRTGLVGRLYGGYMTLTLAGRHPDLSAKGKEVENLVLEDEGRDVLKYVNRARFHNPIMALFERHLQENGS